MQSKSPRPSGNPADRRKGPRKNNLRIRTRWHPAALRCGDPAEPAKYAGYSSVRLRPVPRPAGASTRDLALFISRRTLTAVQYLFSEEWFQIEVGSVLDFALLVREPSGNFSAKPAIQLSPVRPDNPGSPAAIAAGSYTGTAGYTMYHETGFVSSGQMWCRVGIAYKLSAGSTLAAAQVTLQSYLYGCVDTAGGGDVAVNPGMVSGTDINYAGLTGWFPGVGLSKVLAAFIVTENESTYLEYQLVVRTCIDTRTPNGWQTAEAGAGYTNPASTNTERNTGELSVPAGCNLTSNTLVQVGVAWRKKAGAAGNPRAMINAVICVIRD